MDVTGKKNGRIARQSTNWVYQSTTPDGKKSMFPKQPEADHIKWPLPTICAGFLFYYSTKKNGFAKGSDLQPAGARIS